MYLCHFVNTLTSSNITSISVPAFISPSALGGEEVTLGSRDDFSNIPVGFENKVTSKKYDIFEPRTQQRVSSIWQAFSPFDYEDPNPIAFPSQTSTPTWTRTPTSSGINTPASTKVSSKSIKKWDWLEYKRARQAKEAEVAAKGYVRNNMERQVVWPSFNERLTQLDQEDKAKSEASEEWSPICTDIANELTQIGM